MSASAAAKKILVADPSGDSRRSLSVFLRGKGLEIIEAQDGGMALSVVLQNLPDMLILDLSLGVLPPDRLVRILRANPNTDGIPVFYLGDRNEGIAGFRPELDGFLRRPFEEEDLFARMRRVLFPAMPAERELVSLEDLARLRARREERSEYGDGSIERIVYFFPDPPYLEACVKALAAFREFEPEISYFALRRDGDFPLGAFGRIRDGEETALLLYAFPCMRYASPVWHAVAARPIGVVGFFREEAADSLDELMAVSEYAGDSGAGCMLAAIERTGAGIGLGRNTISLFRNHVEKRGGILKVQEMERLSSEEIRRATASVVRHHFRER
ncbi:MAG: hypothetical protein HY896_04965 [Deltaproteobacteria bacterium]|nr:hypothetical protein [Deltaproteobacteria bacterium]